MPPADYFTRQHMHNPSETARRMWFYVRSVGWCACSPDQDATRESIYDYRLQYIIRGSGQVRQNDRVFPAPAGSVVFLDMRREHRCVASSQDPWEILWVHFGGRQCADYFQLLLSDEFPVCATKNSGKLKKLFLRLYDLIASQPPDCEVRASHCIAGILAELVADRIQEGDDALSLAPSVYPDAVRDGIDFMENHFCERLALETIAQHVALSPFHYARVFKRATGMSVMTRLLQIRIAQAKIMLAETDLSVRDIAEKCGFVDQGYFGKQFKRSEEATPSEFRALHKPIQSE
ncbi:MAG: helix-turn-helix domain-containing protein [Bacilli bacterium]